MDPQVENLHLKTAANFFLITHRETVYFRRGLDNIVRGAKTYTKRVAA